MRDSERRDDCNKWTYTAKRNQEANHEQQVINAVENMFDAGLDEAEECVMPTRIQPHAAGISGKFEYPLHPVRVQESHDCRCSQSKTGEIGLNGKVGGLALRRIMQQHIQQRLIAIQLRVVGQRRIVKTGERTFIAVERPVRREGQSRRNNFPLVELVTVFEQSNFPGDPDHRRIPDRCVRLRDHEVARAALRKVDVTHRVERHANEEIDSVSAGFQDGLNHDVGRHVVGDRPACGHASDDGGDACHEHK